MAIGDGEFRRLLGAVEKAKYRLCFSLMYACGLRSGEAVGLPIERIDGARRILRIVGKGDKERLVPLLAVLPGPMRAFWATHRNRTWLFPAQRGDGPMALKYVRIAFRRACAEAGLPRIVTPHSLRHGYATRLLEANVSIRVVQGLLGHASIRSTQRYTHLTEPIRRQVHASVDALFAGLRVGRAGT